MLKFTLTVAAVLVSMQASADSARVASAQARFAAASRPLMSELADHTLTCISLMDNTHSTFNFHDDIEAVAVDRDGNRPAMTFRPDGKSLVSDDVTSYFIMAGAAFTGSNHYEIRKDASGKFILNFKYLKAPPEAPPQPVSDGIPEQAPRKRVQIEAKAAYVIGDTLVCISKSNETAGQ